MPTNTETTRDAMAAQMSKQGKWFADIPNPKIRFLGIRHWGDIGPLTVYNSRRKKSVIYAKAPPKCVASLGQIRNRHLFRCAGIAWGILTQREKADWERAVKKLSLGITGYNLWTFTIHKKNLQIARAVEAASGIPLKMPDVGP
ncbi:MAG: hypothetical protein FVQ81_18305 [Candidatus Glassbacteria bacterium]|nr:hypothetical protein [Candidatus Glassbacteria bacterium]